MQFRTWNFADSLSISDIAPIMLMTHAKELWPAYSNLTLSFFFFFHQVNHFRTLFYLSQYKKKFNKALLSFSFHQTTQLRGNEAARETRTVSGGTHENEYLNPKSTGLSVRSCIANCSTMPRPFQQNHLPHICKPQNNISTLCKIKLVTLSLPQCFPSQHNSISVQSNQ